MFGNSEKALIGNVCSTHARIGWQRLTRSEFQKTGQYLLITGWDIDADNHTVNYSKCYFVKKERYEQDAKLKLKTGDILLTKDGTLGKVALIKALPFPTTLNGHIFVIRPNDQNSLMPEFLMSCFLTDEFKDQMESNKTGSTIVGVTQSAIRSFKIPLPSIGAQKEYVTFIEKINKLKFSLQQTIDKAKRISAKILNDALTEK